MLAPLIPLANRLLRQEEITLTVVDAGCRGGVTALWRVAPFVQAWGFEPHPDEFARLDGDRLRAARPPYQRLQHFELALTDAAGTQTFHMTRASGASSLLEPDLETTGEIIAKGRIKGTTMPKRFETTYAAHHLADARAVEVRTARLDDVVREEAIPHLDLLKVDVQGGEYELLEGARETLGSIGVVNVEVSFVPQYRDQKLFSHVDLQLREHGFELLNYEVGAERVIYKERTTPIEIVPRGGAPDPYAQPLCADAIYVNRRIVDEPRVIAQAIVLMHMTYLDEALHLLKRRTAVRDVDLLETLRTIGTNTSGGWLLRYRGYDLVDRALDLAGSASRLARRTRG